jgi:hypothetical protein
MVDLPRPIKRQMPAYKEAEDVLMAVICRRFGLDPVMPAEVHEADSRILIDEKNYLMEHSVEWGSLTGLKPLGVQILAWSPMVAQHNYLVRLQDLIQ